MQFGIFGKALQADEQNVIGLINGHGLYCDLILLAPVAVHGIHALHDFRGAESFEAVLESRLLVTRNWENSHMELFEQDILLLAHLALVDSLIPPVNQVVDDRFLPRLVLLLRLLPQDSTVSLILPQLFINARIGRLSDFVHVLVQHTQNCPEDLAGIMLLIALKEGIIL